MANTVELVREHLIRFRAAQGFRLPVSASVTFLGVEPIEVLRWADWVGPDGRVDVSAPGGGPVVHYASVGCSRHPMTDPTALVTATDGPRAELLIEMRPDPATYPARSAEATLAGLHRTVAVLAAAPAVEGLVLVPDALVDLGAPLWQGAPFTGVLLEESDIDDLSAPGGAPVRFLRAVPITANEAAWVRLKGAQALRAAWAEAGIDPTDPGRGAVSGV